MRGREKSFDVVLLGDSITERFDGTANLRSRQLPDHRDVFQQYFGASLGGEDATPGSISGLAIGLAGATSNKLLWSVENGVIARGGLEPKSWLVMVGTNDIGRMGCSKAATLAGTGAVIDIRRRRPRAAIIVHALLPRSDLVRPTDQARLRAGPILEQDPMDQTTTGAQLQV